MASLNNFTVEAEGTFAPHETVPFTFCVAGTEVNDSSSKTTSTSSSVRRSTLERMGAAFADSVTIDEGTKKSKGYTHSVLAAIAEDEDLLSEFPLSTLSRDDIPEKLLMDVCKKLKSDLREAVKDMTKAQILSICFLMDTTGSMDPYMDELKKSIPNMIRDIRKSGCRVEAISFVGYKDWEDGDHIEVFPFSNDFKQFEHFVGGLTAGGGGDFPEDVLGGLHEAVHLDWPSSSGTRIIFHVGDAPAHGRRFHDRPFDDYMDGHDQDPSLPLLFSKLKSLNIIYQFGRVGSECDKMIKVFEEQEHYGERIDVYDMKDASALAASVSVSVSASVSLMSGRAKSASSSHRIRPYRLDSTLVSLAGDKALPVLSGTICSYKLPSSVKSIQAYDPLVETVNRCSFKIAPRPFAKGSCRLAYAGQMIYKSSCDDVVFKEFITLPSSSSLDRSRYMAEMEIQTVASKLALDFNDKLSRTTENPGVKLKFLMAKVIKLNLPDGRIRWMSYEKKYRTKEEASIIGGGGGGGVDVNDDGSAKFIKFTNNLSYVRVVKNKEEKKMMEIATAFSHFTYHYTNKYLLVNDLQGQVVQSKKSQHPAKDGASSVSSEITTALLLTDPAIHCPAVARFGKTNLQLKGIEGFFSSHKCNCYCRALGLSLGAEGSPRPASSSKTVPRAASLVKPLSVISSHSSYEESSSNER